MAVNASPMYQKAEEQYRSASTPAEKIAAIEEMLRLIPKHKASEKLQAQLKQRLKAARLEKDKGHSKKGGGQRDLFAILKQGAGQVMLLGDANVGKSSIVHARTEAKVEVADFPFSTHAATPGMAYHEDVAIQLVDMPPIMDGHAQPGMIGAYRATDIILLLVDLSSIDIFDQFEKPLAVLAERNLRFVSEPILEFDEDEEAAVPKRVLVAANKCDTHGAMDNYEGLQELEDTNLKMVPVSAQTGEGLDTLMATLFDLLNVIRIYPKKPGKPVDLVDPFIMTKGGSVYDLAHQIHRELAEKLKGARVWGTGVHDGQQVHHTHILVDKDVVELRF